MNDFTKEELIQIYWKFEHFYDQLEDLTPKNAIMLKLEAMIDNYCEHECEHAWVVARDEPIGIDECTNRFFICVKCYEVDR